MKSLGMSLLVLIALVSIANAKFSPDETMLDLGASEIASTKDLTRAHDKTERLLRDFEQELAPTVERHGGKLFVILEWESDRINAEAKRNAAQEWEIVVYGGAARYQDFTERELALIMCHELGHHLGGSPFASRNGWSSTEGQSDYWSTLQCFRNIYQKFTHLTVSNEAQEFCQNAQEVSTEYCLQAAEGSLRISRFYAQNQRFAGYPELNRQELAMVTRIHYGYPNPQCRLDTLKAGILEIERPQCWYPKENH